MKKTIYLMLFLFVFGTVILDAQVRIGGDIAPHGSAALDLNADDKDEPANFGGFLLPRIRLTDVKQPLNSVNPLNGAIVWNTNDDFYLGKGVYVWGDSVWVPIQRTLIGNSTYQSVTTTPNVAILSNPALGLGVIFQVLTSYGDWNNTARFIWEITANGNPDYEPEILISGSKQEVVFVPYDGTARTYSAKVKPIPNNGTTWNEWSADTISVAGKYQGLYRLIGPTGYDILATRYYTTDSVGRDSERTQMHLDSNYYTVEMVSGIDGTPTYKWEIVHSNVGNLAYLGTVTDSSTVELIFNNGILTKDNLVGKPGVADTIVLRCTVDDGITDLYVLDRTITVGDRDECSPAAGLLDAEGNSYTVSRFGGVCWMTENLRSTWTKQGSQVQTIDEGKNELNDQNAVVYNYPGSNTNSPSEYGFLYTWGAANIGTMTTEATNAFRDTTSNRQGICPEGWTLPSDYDWNQLEREIATHPGKYSSEQTAYPWNSSYETYTGWRPGEGNSSLNWWGRTMKSNTKVINVNSDPVSTVPLGVSNENGTGFNALLVGIFESGSSANFGTGTNFWSSSAGSATAAWRRGLGSGYSGATRSTYGKDYLFSVRCKK
ncbi:MAG: fibrobacter succinogenes major paralogous domain-containing protein [Dysgonamonadaceae bacterium]|nr:fibrobacter succinogenes major paralogous domain-containing protein [Dysgonamonadaceae bacterium]